MYRVQYSRGHGRLTNRSSVGRIAGGDRHCSALSDREARLARIRAQLDQADAADKDPNAKPPRPLDAKDVEILKGWMAKIDKDLEDEDD